MLLRVCFLAIALYIAATSGCRDLDRKCKGWKPYCNTNSIVIQRCKRTCNRCVYKQESCIDKDSRCKKWKGYCQSNKYVIQNCLKTCKRCAPKGPRKGCKNKNKHCEYWAQKGECKKNPRYMLKNCKLACGCGKKPTRKPKTKAPITTTAKPDINCRNRNRYCDIWFKRGECQKNPKYMKIYCQKSCNLCDKVVPTRRPRITTKPKIKTNAPRTTTTTTTTTTKTTQRRIWKCGYNKYNNPFISYVVGGKISSQEKWIWQAAIYYYDVFICGGTLIGNQYIVTAAHCMNDYGYLKDREGLDVVLGDWDRETKDGKEQKFQVEKFWSHPMYFKTKLDFDNDIAVIKLSKPAQFKINVNEACLPSKSEQLSENTKCYISGWGKDESTGDVVNKLLDVQLSVVSNTLCATKNKDPNGASLINNNMLCAGSAKVNQGSCGGDSGGPLVCLNKSNQWVLQGAVSWGSSYCDSRIMYPVFARVSNYVDWIKKVMEE